MLTWTLKPWQRALFARLDVPPGLIWEIKPRAVFLEHAIVSNRHSGVSSQNAHPQHRQAFSLILKNVKKMRRQLSARAGSWFAAASGTAETSRTESRS